MIEAKAVRYAKHGHPTNVLRIDTLRIDTATALRPSDVLVRILAAPITSLDFAQISGFGGRASSFPRVAGNEGVGIVEEVGSGASTLRKGDFVVASVSGVGTWATHAVAPESSWTKLEGAAAPGSADFPVEHASVCVTAPLTAQALLASAPLSKGSVVVQNGADSLVGQAVIQYAKAAGAKTVNIMAPRSDWDNIVYHMQGLGAALVVNEAYSRTPAFAKLLADIPAPVLGLNAVGGAAFTGVARALGKGAVLVTYAGAASSARAPIRVPLDLFTQRDIRLSGFNIDAHLRAMTKTQRDDAVNAAAALLRGGDKGSKLKLLLAREPFRDFNVALTRSLVKGERTVVLTMQ